MQNPFLQDIEKYGYCVFAPLCVITDPSDHYTGHVSLSFQYICEFVDVSLDLICSVSV